MRAAAAFEGEGKWLECVGVGVTSGLTFVNKSRLGSAGTGRKLKIPAAARPEFVVQFAVTLLANHCPTIRHFLSSRQKGG